MLTSEDTIHNSGGVVEALERLRRERLVRFDEIIATWAEADPRIPLIGLARAMDQAQFGAWALERTLRSSGDVTADLEGWGLAVRPFMRRLSRYLAASGTPLFVSDESMERGSAAILVACSELQLLTRAMRLADTPSRQSSARPNAPGRREETDRVDVVLDTAELFASVSWREDEADLRRMARDTQGPRISQLARLRPRILRLMRERSAPWNEHFPSYESTPVIEKWYRELGRIVVARMSELGFVSETALFGGIPFATYVEVVADQVGYSFRHLDHCVLLREMHSGLREANLLTITQDREHAWAAVQELYGLSEEAARQIIDVLTFVPEDANAEEVRVMARFAESGVADPLPPFLQTSRNQHLRLLSGALGEPLRFLHWSLQRRFPDDWRRAVDGQGSRILGSIRDVLIAKARATMVTEGRRGVLLLRDVAETVEVEASDDRGTAATTKTESANRLQVSLGPVETDSIQRSSSVDGRGPRVTFRWMARTLLHVREDEQPVRRLWEEATGKRLQLRSEVVPICLLIHGLTGGTVVIWSRELAQDTEGGAPQAADDDGMVTLERAIELEHSAIQRAMRGVDALYALAELVRSRDAGVTSAVALQTGDTHRSVSAGSNEETAGASVQSDHLVLSFGYPKALALAAALPRGEVWPPREPPPVVAKLWGYALAWRAGHIAEAEQALAMVRTGLATIARVGPGHLAIELRPDVLEVESVERGHWQRFVAKLVGAQAMLRSRLDAERAGLSKRMSRYVSLSEHGELRIRLPRGIQRHVLETALYSLGQRLGSDSFPDEAAFGGVPFSAYRTGITILAAEALIRVTAAEAIAASDTRFEAWEVKSTGWRIPALAKVLSSAPGLDYDQAVRVIEASTLGPAAAHSYRRVPRAALPPLIGTASDHVLMSVAGCLDEPFQFLLHRLRELYPTDWDRSVDSREAIFRDDLYASLTSMWPERYVTAPRGAKLRDAGRVVTDVDAMIFDRQTGDLGLFQLKWQDAFGASLVRRASSAKNFVQASERWVETVHTWTATQSMAEMAQRLGIPVDCASRIQPRLFVLGRMAAHFSGHGAPDARAAWGTWPQLLNLVADTHRTAQMETEVSSAPLSWLDAKLREQSPFVQRPTEVPEAYEVLVAGLRVTVSHASAASSSPRT
jgi:hypothetical protein